MAALTLEVKVSPLFALRIANICRDASEVVREIAHDNKRHDELRAIRAKFDALRDRVRKVTVG